ncbi:MAG: GPR endopeptidase [Clostridia bacterium]|nr:GPR endopeptidase [Clostridia bacterium]
MQNIRTDLALEAFDGQGASSLPGVDVRRWEAGGVTLTEVVVSDDDASRLLNKSVGRYLTLECGLLRRRDPDARAALGGLLAEELSRMLPPMDGGACALVLGLGNRQITPDALGPSVVDRLLVTRHLIEQLANLPGLRPVSAIAPGVLGVTGIETMELAERLVDLVKPAAVVCVDALAARDSARVGTTLQLTDTGIQPGAGVGNHRRALTRDSVGAPVIAIGMPTVVHAATLARNAFDWLDRQRGATADPAALDDMERALLSAAPGDMIVTPREIDSIIQDAAGIVAAALNRALQPDLSDAEIAAMMD